MQTRNECERHPTQTRTDELKLRALKNFALTCKYKEWVSLELLTHFLSQNKLDSGCRAFMNHLLSKYKIDYLDWCFRTGWVKDRIAQATLDSKSRIHKGQMYFDFGHEVAFEVKELQKQGVLMLSSFPYQNLKLAKALQFRN